MEVNRRPVLDPVKVCDFYSKKDGVPVTYVISTQKSRGTPVADVFYRSTPHPYFDNRYFGLYYSSENVLMITGADWVEGLEFGMIKCDGLWEYSQHVHDYRQTNCGSIDGGREYVHVGGDTLPEVTIFKVKDGVLHEQ